MNALQRNVHTLIEQHLPSKNKEKSNLGEVFTPVNMIENMYNHFPSSAFHKNKTWLDPCTGIGNFMLVLFFILMTRLRSIPFAQRAKHIIENMLFMVEINPNNVTVCKKIFHKLCPGAKPNIHKGDFLKEMPTGWPQTFSVVVGNPPYNIGGTARDGTKRAHIAFTERAISISDFVAYICPPSYREADTPMNLLFRAGHLHYIKIYGAKETFDLFRIQGRVDTFIYECKKSYKQTSKQTSTTLIHDEYGIEHKVHLDLSRHIPNFGHSIFEKLHRMVLKLGKVDAFRTTEMSSIKSHSFGCGKHKVMHLIVEQGRRVFKTVKKHSLTDQHKIMVNGLGIPYVFHDTLGRYGPSQSPIIVLNPSNALVQLMLSDFFPFIAWGLRLTGNNNLPYLFDYVPQVTGSLKTMDQIQAAFGLTRSEIQFVRDHFAAYSYQDKDILEPCKPGKTKKNKRAV
jgi:N-6 DNA Methylase